jgi:hydroxyacylglutathione hydrolase
MRFIRPTTVVNRATRKFPSQFVKSPLSSGIVHYTFFDSHPSNFPMPPTPPPHFSANSVRCYTGGFTATNGFVIEVPGGCLAVDAPEGFAQWLEQQGLKVLALLLTHAHFDHVIDAAAIHEKHGCPIYAWEVSTAESRLETFLWQAAGMKFEVTDYPVAVLLKGVASVNVEGITFELAYVPGHSMDSVVFIDRSHGRAFSGDTLMQGTMGRTDFPGGGTAMLLRGIRQHLMTLPNDTKIYSGHGDPTTVAAERRWVESAL